MIVVVVVVDDGGDHWSGEADVFPDGTVHAPHQAIRHRLRR